MSDTPEREVEPDETTTDGLPPETPPDAGGETEPEPEPAPLQLKRPPWDGTGPRFRGLKAKRASQPAPEPQEDANEPQEASVGQEEAEDAQEGAQSVADQDYQPYDHTVVEVQAYLADNPDQTQYVLDRERAGKNRVTLTGGES